MIYHDTCIDDSKGNVHTSLRKLSELVAKEYRNQVYCIHIDGDNFIEEVSKEGSNIVNTN